MATERMFRVSIVIPSHNRRARLLAALDAIGRQRFPIEDVEVIVVADGCVDDTVAAVNAYKAPFALQVIELPGLGPSAARNRGASLAVAPLLLFLDDDVEPLEHWIAVHVEAHEGQPDCAVIGPYPPYPDGSRDEFRALVRGWWTAHFDELARTGHRFTYRDMLTGNLSMPRALWDSLGGLDEDLVKAHEDWELGLRLIARGIPIIYARQAFCWHHEYATMTVQGSLQRAREEGRADVVLGRKYPSVRDDLPILGQWRARHGLGGRVGSLVFQYAGFGDAVAGLASTVTGLLARCSSGPVFRAFYGVAQRLSYLRGAATELRTIEAWQDFAAETPKRRSKSILIDLREGVETAERRLAEHRPDDARLMYGTDDLGWLPFASGAEPWDSRHLRPYLAWHMQGVLLYALRKDDIMPADDAWPYVGAKGYFPALGEALGQWDKSRL